MERGKKIFEMPFDGNGDVGSVRIVGIPNIGYNPLDHDPHPLVQSTFGTNLRTPVLEAFALGMAQPRGER